MASFIGAVIFCFLLLVIVPLILLGGSELVLAIPVAVSLAVWRMMLSYRVGELPKDAYPPWIVRTGATALLMAGAVSVPTGTMLLAIAEPEWETAGWLLIVLPLSPVTALALREAALMTLFSQRPWRLQEIRHNAAEHRQQVRTNAIASLSEKLAESEMVPHGAYLRYWRACWALDAFRHRQLSPNKELPAQQKAENVRLLELANNDLEFVGSNTENRHLRRKARRVRAHAQRCMQRLRPAAQIGDVEKAVERGCTQLQSWIAARRLAALDLLADIGAPGAKAIPQILPVVLTRTRMTEERRKAIETLVSIGPSAMEALAAVLQTTPDGKVAGCAAEALGQFGPAASGYAALLVTMLKSEDFDQSYWAAKGLGQMGNAILPTLLPVFDDTSIADDTRQLAAEAVARLDLPLDTVPQVRNVLVKALDSVWAETALAACRHLASIGAERDACRRALHRLDENGVKEAVEVLKQFAQLPPDINRFCEGPCPATEEDTGNTRLPLWLSEVRRCVGDFKEPHLFLAPNIPDTPLKNVISTYASGTEPNSLILLWDDTVFGSAHDGFCVTDDAIYWHNTGEQPGCLRITDIKTITLEPGRFFRSAAVTLNDQRLRIQVSAAKAKVAEILANVIESLRSHPSTYRSPGNDPQLASDADLVRFQCQNCKKRFRVARSFAGKRARCPGCSSVIRIPVASSGGDQTEFSDTSGQKLAT